MAGPKPEPTVVPISTAVMQPDAQPQASQQAVRLNDICVGNKDGRGVPITQIYPVQSDEYAIYQAGQVMVHFADDHSKEQAQRKAIFQSVRLGRKSMRLYRDWCAARSAIVK